MKKGVFRNFVNVTEKHLQMCLILINSGIFRNTYFEVQTLENEIYSWLLMSDIIYSLLGKVKKVYWNSFTVKGICCSVKC